MDLDEDNSNPKYVSLDLAKQKCEAKGYAGFTYCRQEGRAWYLQKITNPEQWGNDARFDVWTYDVPSNKACLPTIPRLALCMPQFNTGSRYRCGKSTAEQPVAAAGEKGPERCA